MEKITLNLTVSIGLAKKILSLMEQNETVGNLNDYEEIIPEEQPVETPKVDTPAPKKDTPKVSLDDVRKAFTELSHNKGKDVAKQVIADLGYKRVTEIPESEYSNAFNTVKEAM